MKGELVEPEYDAELEARISEDEAVRREESASMRRFKFAEVETLAKRLFGRVVYDTDFFSGDLTPQTISAARAFDMAQEFMAERDHRKARS